MKLPIDVLIEILDELRAIRKVMTGKTEHADLRTAEQRMADNVRRLGGDIKLRCPECGYEVLRNKGPCQQPGCPFKTKSNRRDEVERA